MLVVDTEVFVGFSLVLVVLGRDGKIFGESRWFCRKC